MDFTESLQKIRIGSGLSQEQFAQAIDVSRQAVQKWETGASKPGIEHLIKISKYFGVSVDSIIFGNERREEEELTKSSPIFPDYNALPPWEMYAQELEVEYRQCVEEGKDISMYKDLFEAVARMPKTQEKKKIADELFSLISNAPQTADYKYNEPSELARIKGLRQQCTSNSERKDKIKDIEKKISGAWYGRIAGCLLGKTVECIRTPELKRLLKESGNYPMHRYIFASDVTEQMYRDFKFNFKGRCFADKISCAPSDDDTNYTVLASVLIDKYGRDFTPANVLQLWTEAQPKSAYCTAERVAFCNAVKGYVPPYSAVYQNPYREWIGAQIRADYFGYINPGDPETAADMAFRDASISHVKNGIYGEMFVAAMISYAAVCDDITEIVKAGMSQIPSTSRLYEAVKRLLDGFSDGVVEKEAFERIHSEYDEFNGHDWCHVISNCLIVVASLLYGKGDFGKSICLAVQTGFDTDCNGATVGSVLGMRGGESCIGEEWKKPINGKLDTAIFGVGRVSIEDLVKKTMKHIAQ